MANIIIKEIYKGYEIHKRLGSPDGYTDYYYIHKGGERVSQMCLSSIKSCKNVIDTHERNIAESQKPIYK